VAFEQIAVRLTQFERLYFEWDGSFVWTGEHAGQRWQIDGVLYDGAGSMQYIDLKGRSPWHQWRKLLEALCGECSPETLTVLELPQQIRRSLLSFEQEAWSEPE
jgi:hypothetical protein